MAKMLLLDVEKQELREVIANSLEDYYSLLDCRTIEIFNLPVINKDNKIMNFDIICDEEGRMRDNNLVSAFDFKNKEVSLVRNLLITKPDGLGNERSLSKQEKVFVETSIRQIPFECVDIESKLTIKTNIKVLSLWN